MCLVEINLPFLRERIWRNCGWIFSYLGRALFILFAGSMCLALYAPKPTSVTNSDGTTSTEYQGSATESVIVAVAAITIANAAFNLFILAFHPEVKKAGYGLLQNAHLKGKATTVTNPAGPGGGAASPSAGGRSRVDAFRAMLTGGGAGGGAGGATTTAAAATLGAAAAAYATQNPEVVARAVSAAVSSTTLQPVNPYAANPFMGGTGAAAPGAAPAAAAPGGAAAAGASGADAGSRASRVKSAAKGGKPAPVPARVFDNPVYTALTTPSAGGGGVTVPPGGGLPGHYSIGATPTADSEGVMRYSTGLPSVMNYDAPETSGNAGTSGQGLIATQTATRNAQLLGTAGATAALPGSPVARGVTPAPGSLPPTLALGKAPMHHHQQQQRGAPPTFAAPPPPPRKSSEDEENPFA